MRPKSMATVVETFVEGTGTSSMPMPALVMSASVRSGAISDTAPTKVVLPTPNPPATTIFADVIRSRGGLSSTKSIEHPLDQLSALVDAGVVGQRRLDPHETLVQQVRDQHPRHPERHGQVRGDLGDRARLQAQLRHRPLCT